MFEHKCIMNNSVDNDVLIMCIMIIHFLYVNSCGVPVARIIGMVHHNGNYVRANVPLKCSDYKTKSFPVELLRNTTIWRASLIDILLLLLNVKSKMSSVNTRLNIVLILTNSVKTWMVMLITMGVGGVGIHLQTVKKLALISS